MSFLGLSSGPPTSGAEFLQSADIAIASNVARDIALKNRVRRLRGGMGDLGAVNPTAAARAAARQAHQTATAAAAQYRYFKRRGMGELGATPARGTRAWWQWYATQYLPQYYSQQQVQQYVYSSPYYTQYGSPYGVANPYQYPYSTYNYPNYQNGYPYYGYGNQYYNPYAQAQYTTWQGEQGSAACAQQGGYWDPTQMSCNAVTGQQPYGSTVYGPTGTPPNVIGLPEWQAVAMLNAAGFNVWEISRDGISQGAPPGYSSNRVDISVSNGVVNAAAVG